MWPEDAITSRGPLSYKDAGVDIDAGDAFVEAIKPLAAATARPGSAAGLGGFGAVFDPAAAGYRDPLLVATTDGVGTKLKLAGAAGRHRGLGVDLVAMCVNDLVVQGAEPLFFLDYFATARLDPELGRELVAGIAEGCRAAGCALVGGETAEMPGLYGPGDYDLAGFAVGAVERGRELTGAAVEAGDVVLGLASNGLHSNGFSLVRRIVEEAGLGLAAAAPFAPQESLAEALLRPTRIYVASCLAAHRAGLVKALAHVTGGGLPGNLPRTIPPALSVSCPGLAWELPGVFRWLSAAGGVPPREMLRSFNCGIGMAAVVAPEAATAARAHFTAAGETVFEIGRIAPRRPGAPGFETAGLEADWPRGP